MKINFKNRFEILDKSLDCQIDISLGKVHQIIGENGMGKTSLLTFFKQHQEEFFSGKRLVFIDQYPLMPLNSISFLDIEKLLKASQFEELPFLEEFRKLASPFYAQSVKSLSGGQNQLIKILISLYLSGDIFFFDEPFQYLDQAMRERVKELFRKLKAQGKTLVIIEHSNHLCSDLIDESIYFKTSNGKIVVNHGI